MIPIMQSRARFCTRPNMLEQMDRSKRAGIIRRPLILMDRHERANANESVIRETRAARAVLPCYGQNNAVSRRHEVTSSAEKQGEVDTVNSSSVHIWRRTPEGHTGANLYQRILLTHNSAPRANQFRVFISLM